MQNKFFSLMYGINIVSQAVFSLITPALIMFGVGWLFVSRVGAPEWIYAILIPIGVITGFISMVKFVIRASTSLERLEKQNRKGKDKDE